jgi:uncharacterized protein
MKTPNEAKRLRVYISSTDRFRYTPLYEVLVFAAKRYGLSGATVYKGIMGFGASSEVHSYKLWELTEKMPLIVEMVDEPEKILKFYETIKPYFEMIAKGCMITIEDTNVVIHKTGDRKK